MTSNLHTPQRPIDAFSTQKTRVRISTPLERIVELAKNGVRDPGLLEPEDVQLICGTLLMQYAQMGIG